MSNAEKLKRRAVEYESKRQLDRAIAAYLELFAEWDGEDLANIEVSLYNRAGDLMLREGRAADAIGVWERAVDLYADGGFLNNAIALCNKILRYAPNHNSIYYKLGRISAQKGFRGDAKKNFLEYADRKQRANDIDEAFRALKEFADLCPEEDDIRQMVADQLTKLGRTREALEQLQLLFERYEAMGDDALAAATLARMRAIDPAVEPLRRGPSRLANLQGLVFLDLDDAPAPRRTAPGSPPRAAAPEPPPPPSPPVPPPVAQVAPPQAPPPAEPLPFVPMMDGVADQPPPASAAAPEAPQARATAEWLAGFEPTRLTDDELSAAPGDTRLRPGDDALLGLEPTAFDLGTFGETTPTVESEAGAEALYDDTLPTSPTPELVFLDATDPMTPADVTGAPEAVGGTMLPVEASEGSSLDVILDPTMLDDPASALGWSPEAAPPEADSSPATADAAAPAALGGLEFIRTDDVGTDDADHAGPSPEPLTELSGPPIAEDAAEPTIDLLTDAPIDEQSLPGLAARVERDPSDWWTRRLFGERLLADGEQHRGTQELERAMEGLEGAGDLGAASEVAETLAVLAPDDVRLHQKRVEYAVRTSDRGRLIEAYLALAAALRQSGQSDKARVVYARVSELAPGDTRPALALRALDPPPPRPATPGIPTPAESRRTTSRKRYTTESPVVEEPPQDPLPGETAPVTDEDFVSLGDWLREEDGPKSTRMVVDEEAPSGDEDADFRDMLRKFKQGVADNVDDADHESHYDLGIAFKEMGLVDEAIAQFQKALRGASHRARTYEALGQCFTQKGQTQVAMTILQRALSEPGVGDDQLVGVLYLLGDAAASLGRVPEAIGYFQRVFAVDITFRDVGDRLNELERGTA